MTTGAIKITKKGQVTIPREIRKRLMTDTIYFDVAGGEIVLKAVKDAGGSLHEYAKNAQRGLSIGQMKEKAWEEAAREKTRKKSS